MTDEIATLLDALAEIHFQLDVLRMDRDEAIKTAIPAEWLKAIDDINAECEQKTEAAKENIAEIEAKVKQLVLEGGATVRGQRLTAIYNEGRISYDAKSLDGFMLAHPELAAFRKQGEPSVTIRWR